MATSEPQKLSSAGPVEEWVEGDTAMRWLTSYRDPLTRRVARGDPGPDPAEALSRSGRGES